MSTITNLATLKSSISGWLNRSDLDEYIPQFIQLAESDFNNRLRTREMIKRATASLATEYVPIPAGMLQIRNIQLNTDPQRLLEYKTPEELDELALTYTTVGRPVYYTLLGEAIQVKPAPDTTYTVEVAYYNEIPALSDANTSNWLLSKSPNIYLYSALYHSASFLMADERIPVWERLMNTAIETLNYSDQQSKYSGVAPKISFSTVG